MRLNELQIFKNDEFGQVRTLVEDGQPWFVAKDVAEILGYANPRDAISKHVDAEDKGVANCDTLGGKQELTVINESGLYALVFGSRLDTAKRFKRWVTSEVLPALRKTGAYIMPQSRGLEFLQGMLDEMKRQAAEIQEVKTTAKAIKDAIVEVYDEWREDIRYKVSAIQKATGDTYANTWNALYDELERRAHCDLSIRVTNGRFRLQEAGATKKTTEAYGRLDVIEHDPRLKEIFTAIVKEYTVKYVA
jgi:prophage antirepressor-like protein